MNNIKNKKRLIKIIILGVLALALILLVLEKTKVTNFYEKNPSGSEQAQTQDEQSKVDLSPATETDKAENDARKASLPENGGDVTPPPSSGVKTVRPVITYAGQYGDNIEVGSYVPGIYETGECTLTLTRGSHTITRNVTAIIDSSSTTCPSFSVSRSVLPEAGKWTAVVSYRSAAAVGGSDEKSLEVNN